eukprot:TRINITY_DN5650_c0_g3_i1.p1 TRINITY_DN5650_c0_g3~~TRINITY_DN5650_c0_g3_i1.p1  ORF type:complete len:207 (-),score=23.75 TRINITY_DN5650_c0_g3_i1:9-575(-)
MALYGWALNSGIGIPENKQRSKQLLRQSQHGTARVFRTLGLMDIGHAEKECCQLLTTQCDTSDPHVRYMLGECYQWGFGCRTNKAQAILWYERAGNHVGALVNLALLLLAKKQCDAADCQLAIALYRQAAAQGDAAAQYQLGVHYHRGIPGVLERDIEQAKHWCTLCTEQGSRPAAAEALRRISLMLR